MLVIHCGDVEKQKERNKVKMRELISKLEDQAKNLDELKRMRNDLRLKTADLMRTLDNEMDIQKRLEHDQKVLLRENTLLKRQINGLKGDKKGTHVIRELTKNSIYHLEQQVEASRRLGYDDLKITEDLKRDRDLLDTDINKAGTNNKKQEDAVRMKNE